MQPDTCAHAGWAGPTPAVEIVVPAYNEATRLPGTLWVLSMKLRQLPVPAAVVVVDNGSTDATAAIVRGWPRSILPVRLVECADRGKGAAVRAGLLETSAAVVGFCDADLATDPAALEQVIRLVQSGHEAVIGSRGHPGSVVQARHSVSRRVGAVAFRAAAGLVVAGVRDTQCGYKFFHGPTARAVASHLCSRGFAFDVELLGRLQRLGGRIVEIPVCWRDVPGSTFSPARDGWRSFREVFHIWSLLRAEVAAAAGAHQLGLAPGFSPGLAAGLIPGLSPVLDPVRQRAGGAPRRAWAADPGSGPGPGPRPGPGSGADPGRGPVAGASAGPGPGSGPGAVPVGVRVVVPG